MKRDLYPKDWPAISKRIRARDGNACKFCGVANGKEVVSKRTGKHYHIVLTVAHLNHDPSDCRDENLAALCQPCHLTYDAEHHAKNARKTHQDKTGKQRQEQLAAYHVASPCLIELT